MGVRILFLGEIVGRPGIHTVKAALATLRKERKIDFVVANAEGATGGFGIGKNHALQLRKLGVDLITTGEKTYYKIDMVEHITQDSRILRPANYPFGNPGKPFRTVEINGLQALFVVLLGNANFPRTHLNNPFITMQSLLERFKADYPLIFVQFHASTSAEKQTMGYYLNGRVSAVIGTHSKVLTADAQILGEKTAFITDNGRCGSTVSVGGFDPQIEIERYLTQVPSRSSEYWESLELQGVLVEVDEQGVALSIETVRQGVEKPQGV